MSVCTKSRVKHNMNMDWEHPILSVYCLVYNHSSYLREALDGIVEQQTNFAYEAIVHDDASTDDSAAIIFEYAEKYPHIIKPILQKENQFSKHDCSIWRTMESAVAESCKYVALCEGDDYWTDRNKLQIQVDFLESHLDFSMVFHRAMEHWENGEHTDNIFYNVEEREYSGTEIYKEWIVATASVVMRKDIFNSDVYRKAIMNNKFLYTDIIFFLSCAHCGKVRGMSMVSSVYRRSDVGMTIRHQRDFEAQYKLLLHRAEIVKVFGESYKGISEEQIVNRGVLYFLDAFWGHYGKPWNMLWFAFKTAPWSTSRLFFSKSLNILLNGIKRRL